MTVIDHYEVKLRQPGKPVDREAISAAERQLAIAFPKPYADFLLANNGGSPSPSYLPYPGQALKIDRFYSIGEGGLVQACQRHRAEHGLPADFLPIAHLGEESLLVMKCSSEDAGSLYLWTILELGFLPDHEEYKNVNRLHCDIAELPLKFGPAKIRQDRDGMFCQLYYASSNPRHGGVMAEKYVKEGYDINFVLPTFRHPIFGAIDCWAFGVAVTMLRLGTWTTHVDPRHENATVEESLVREQEHWKGSLEHSRATNYDTGKSTATRHLSDIAIALAMIRGVTQ